MSKIIRILLLASALITSLFLIFIPNWIKSGSEQELQEWYPVFGKIVYLLIHKLSYGIIIIGFSGFLMINLKKNLNRIRNNKTESFYLAIFSLLIIQFSYCVNYSEFYPAVMMPSFSDGKIDTNQLTDEQYELKVVSEYGKIYLINLEDLIDEIPRSMKSSVLQKIEKKRNYDNRALFEWLANKLSSEFSISDSIHLIEINKISTVYSIQNNNITVLKEEKSVIKKVKR